MEGIIVFAIILVLGLIGAVFILPFVALARAGRAARKAEQSEKNEKELGSRLLTLEQQVIKLTKLVGRVEELERQVAPSKAPAGAIVSEPAAVPLQVKPAHPAPEIPAPPPATAPSARPEIPAPPAMPSPKPPSIPAPPVSAPRVSPSVTRPNIGSTVSTQKKSEKLKSILSLEETLGTNWLNKVGVIILVIGVALFLIYELREMGPGGKLFVSFVVSMAMLVPGIYFESRDNWRILARAGMGGGWALLYFTTYAMNHVAATRILESESADFVLLLIVAAAMVAHTLRYNSQVVTGLAFLLAFTTINISHGSVNSLIAGAILALALAVIVGRRRWFELEVVAILAVFLNHYYWLRPIIEPMGVPHHPFPELPLSTALLISYWLIFRFSYIFRRIDIPNEENVSTVAALLNTCLFHYVINYQAARPELAFWFLVSVGAMEMALGQLPVTRRRRTAFAILTTIGATLLIAAFPFRYSGGRLSVLWLMEAEALFLAGVFTREIVFRYLGMAAQLVVAWHIVFIDSWRLSDARDLKHVDFSDPRLALICAVAALVFYANAHWVPRRWPDLLQTDFEKTCVRFQSYIAGIVAMIGIWALFTEPWLAVAWMAMALALAIGGSNLKIEELNTQANAFALLGFIRIVAVNFAVVEVSYFNWRAVTTISLAIALLYFCSQWIGYPERARALWIPEAYTWVGTFVLTLLLWYQLWPTSVAMGWALVGLMLFQLGYERASASLRFQAYLLFIVCFFRLFLVNFNAVETPGELSPRVYTAIPLALLFYFVYWRLQDNPATFLERDRRMKMAQIHCHLGTITMAAVMRFELDLDWVAAAWSALILVFVLMAWRFKRRVFLHQGLLLGAAVFSRTILHNFYERSYFPPPTFWSGQFATVGTTIVLIFLSLLAAFRLELPAPSTQTAGRGKIKRMLSGLNRRPEQAFFFANFILLTYFLYLELRPYGMATAAWGAEAVAVFLFALAVKERSFRLSAMGLLLACVGKIILVDVWRLAPRDRYLTFIALGVALLSVSFLYTRFREVLQGYL
ncbi:MAG TPA: DUF2339 domain-containing protein [Terriglobia bacterium]|nr:DUF2339 domain-containing protein [Terriglobia bacterium]